MSRKILAMMATLGISLSLQAMDAQPECPQDLWKASLEAYEIGLNVPMREAGAQPGIIQEKSIESHRKEVPIIQLDVIFPGKVSEKRHTRQFEVTNAQGLGCLNNARAEVAKWQNYIDTHVDLSKQAGPLNVEQGLNSGNARDELNRHMLSRAQRLESFWVRVMMDRPGGPVGPTEDTLPALKALREKHEAEMRKLQGNE